MDKSVVPSRDEVWAVVRDAHQELRAGDDVWARITDGVMKLYADALDAKDKLVADALTLIEEYNEHGWPDGGTDDVADILMGRGNGHSENCKGGCCLG